MNVIGYPTTLSKYLIRNFLSNLLGMAGILLGIVYLLDTVELLRRVAKFDDVPMALAFKMGLLKLPEMAQIIFPFIILFSALFTFWQLSKRSELVVIRASGVSVWQFLKPIALTAACAGLVLMTIVNPLGAMFFGKFRNMESQYLNRERSVVALFDEGLWLKQDTKNDGYAMLHAGKLQMPDWDLQKVMVVFFDKDDRMIKRLDADQAKLQGGAWIFRNVVENNNSGTSRRFKALKLSTSLTPKEIEDSFASPETMGFWNLPVFISTLDRTGFDSTKLRIHFQSLLAQPFLFISMILLASTVALRNQRQGGTLLFMAGGVTIGFVVYFFSSFLQALGSSHHIPVFLAAWSPTLLCSLLGIAALLTLEDG